MQISKQAGGSAYLKKSGLISDITVARGAVHPCLDGIDHTEQGDKAYNKSEHKVIRNSVLKMGNKLAEETT